MLPVDPQPQERHEVIDFGFGDSRNGGASGVEPLSPTLFMERRDGSLREISG